ncbi:MAG TPA: DinB family protein [Pyrinomonadaceae bacterium]
MSIAQTLLPEFDHEMQTTRAVLARVPEADADWRPHPKSMTLGQLASHVTNIVRWGGATFELEVLDLASPDAAQFAPPKFETTEKLVERFDANVAETRAALSAAADEEMGVVWTLKSGAQTILAMPRAATYRSFMMSHLIHHRGQLSVYLRLRDVPLPPIYGPTADESNRK